MISAVHRGRKPQPELEPSHRSQVNQPSPYAFAITPASNLSDILADLPFVTRDDYRPYSTQARLRFIQGSKSAQLIDAYLTASGARIATATPTAAWRAPTI